MKSRSRSAIVSIHSSVVLIMRDAREPWRKNRAKPNLEQSVFHPTDSTADCLNHRYHEIRRSSCLVRASFFYLIDQIQLTYVAQHKKPRFRTWCGQLLAPSGRSYSYALLLVHVLASFSNYGSTLTSWAACEASGCKYTSRKAHGVEL